MPVGCSSGQPTGFFVGGAGDKVLRVLNDFNDLKDLKVFKVSDALKYRRLCPPPEKSSARLKVGLNLKAGIRLQKSEKPKFLKSGHRAHVDEVALKVEVRAPVVHIHVPRALIIIFRRRPIPT